MPAKVGWLLVMSGLLRVGCAFSGSIFLKRARFWRVLTSFYSFPPRCRKPSRAGAFPHRPHAPAGTRPSQSRKSRPSAREGRLRRAALLQACAAAESGSTDAPYFVVPNHFVMSLSYSPLSFSALRAALSSAASSGRSFATTMAKSSAESISGRCTTFLARRGCCVRM